MIEEGQAPALTGASPEVQAGFRNWQRASEPFSMDEQLRAQSARDFSNGVDRAFGDFCEVAARELGGESALEYVRAASALVAVETVPGSVDAKWDLWVEQKWRADLEWAGVKLVDYFAERRAAWASQASTTGEVVVELPRTSRLRPTGQGGGGPAVATRSVDVWLKHHISVPSRLPFFEAGESQKGVREVKVSAKGVRGFKKLNGYEREVAVVLDADSFIGKPRSLLMDRLDDCSPDSAFFFPDSVRGLAPGASAGALEEINTCVAMLHTRGGCELALPSGKVELSRRAAGLNVKADVRSREQLASRRRALGADRSKARTKSKRPPQLGR